MDKKKTGELIKEARMQKNYTQGELGDLVGVSDKAVSRWENGQSFPDVGVIESLASILDLSIKEIIIGKREEKQERDDRVVTELIRMASIQQSEKLHEQKRILGTGILLLFIIILCIGSGFSAFDGRGDFFGNYPHIGYPILMAVTYFLLFFAWISEKPVQSPEYVRLEKGMKAAAFLLFVLSLSLGFLNFFAMNNENLPFGMESFEVGPFVNGQFIALFIANMLYLVAALVLYEKGKLPINSGWFVSVASVYCEEGKAYGLFLKLFLSASDANEQKYKETEAAQQELDDLLAAFADENADPGKRLID